MSFNILFGGVEYGPQRRVAEVIAASGATVVCLQEPHSRGWWEKPRAERDGSENIDAIVALLGGGWRSWVGYPQGTAYATAFLSPWTFSVDDGTGTVVVSTPRGNELAVHNVHLVAGPYGPYTAARMLRAGEAPAVGRSGRLLLGVLQTHGCHTTRFMDLELVSVFAANITVGARIHREPRGNQ